MPLVARGRVLESAAILCLVGLVISTAWMSDDAYITLRTIDNFWNGYGLRWNAMERVQSYTHPLWMLVLGAIYGLTREAFWTTLVLSMACTAAAVAMALARIAGNSGGRLVAVALLCGSKAFIEFSTSGLENPLTHLLFALLLWQYWTTPPGASHVWRVSLLTGLIGLNRLDSLAFAGPLLLHALWTARSATMKAAFAAAAGLLPLVAWETFAVFYYGFPLPNSVYAKIATGLPREALIGQGLLYFRDSLFVDPITVPVIAAALVVLAISRRAGDRVACVALALSLLVVVLVGGDYMTGRFLAAPFFVAVLALSRHVPATAPTWALATASVALTVWSASSPQSPWRVWPRPTTVGQVLTHGDKIGDERFYYYVGTGLLPVLGGTRVEDFDFARTGLHWRAVPQVHQIGAVGLAGFYAGPGAHIIDPLALADPLLASLPTKDFLAPGHYMRAIPDGYEKTVESCLSIIFPKGSVRPPAESCYGSPSRVNAIEDPTIAVLYDRLALITQAPLFDTRRLSAIVEANLDRRLR